MPVAMAAVALGGAAVSGLGSYFGAKLQERGQRRALGLQREMYQQTRTDLAPYREAGGIGLSGLQNLLRDPSSFAKDPAYQFAREEGLKALTQRAAAGGTLQSGGTLRDLVKYGQGLAYSGYGQRVGQFQNLASMGQAAATGQAQATQNFAAGAGGLMQGIGQSQALGGLGVAGAVGGGLRDYWMMQQLQQQPQGAYTPMLDTSAGTYY